LDCVKIEIKKYQFHECASLSHYTYIVLCNLGPLISEVLVYCWL